MGEGETVQDEEPVDDGLTEPVVLRLLLVVGVPVGLSVPERETETVLDGVRELVAETEGDRVPVGVKVAVPEALQLRVAVPECEPEMVEELDAVWLGEVVPEGDGE